MIPDNDQYLPIVETRELIKIVLDDYQRYWIDNKVLFKYQLNEFVDNTKYYLSIDVKINNMPSMILFNYSCSINSDDFALRSKNKYQLWRHMLIDMLRMGISGVHKNTVDLYRNGSIDNNGVDYSKYPMYPGEKW